MTVYVDTLIPHDLSGKSAQVQRVFADGACHMFTDGPLEELHAMAERVGLKSALTCRRHHPTTGRRDELCMCWFQPHDSLPHYDLNEVRRRAAVRAGAIECDKHTTVRVMRANRAKRTG